MSDREFWRGVCVAVVGGTLIAHVIVGTSEATLIYWIGAIAGAVTGRYVWGKEQCDADQLTEAHAEIGRLHERNRAQAQALQGMYGQGDE